MPTPPFSNCHLRQAGRTETNHGFLHECSMSFDEEKCRIYILRNLSWVPRTHCYEDGMRIITPDLQATFGDEDSHRSLAVLGKLIILPAPMPFPRCAFQLWKFNHLSQHENENYMLPQTPRTVVMAFTADTTEKLGILGKELTTGSKQGKSVYTNLNFERTTYAPRLIKDIQKESASTSPFLAHLKAVGRPPNVSISNGNFAPKFDIFLNDVVLPLNLVMKFRRPTVYEEDQGVLQQQLWRALCKQNKEFLIDLFGGCGKGDQHRFHVHSGVLERPFCLFSSHDESLNFKKGNKTSENTCRNLTKDPRDQSKSKLEEVPKLDEIEEIPTRSSTAVLLFTATAAATADHSGLLHETSLNDTKYSYVKAASGANFSLNPIAFRADGLSRNYNTDLSGFDSLFRIASLDISNSKHDNWEGGNIQRNTTTQNTRHQLIEYSVQPRILNFQLKETSEPIITLKHRGLSYTSLQDELVDSVSDLSYQDDNLEWYHKQQANSSNSHKNTCTLQDTMREDKYSKRPVQESQDDSDGELGQLLSLYETKPLHIVKQSAQANKTQDQEFHHSSTSKEYTGNPNYPPRSSSLRKSDESTSSAAIYDRERSPNRRRRARSSTAGLDYQGHYISDTHAKGTAPISSKVHHFAGESSGFSGNFIPVESPEMFKSSSKPDSDRGFSEVSSKLARGARAINPYEFEPGSPFENDGHQTIMADFMEKPTAVAHSSSRLSHVKNSRSEGSDAFMDRNHTYGTIEQPRPRGFPVQRGESSPSINSQEYSEYFGMTPSPDTSAYDKADKKQVSPRRRGRSPSRAFDQYGHQYEKYSAYSSEQRSDRHPRDHLRPSTPSRLPHKNKTVGFVPKPAPRDFERSRSPARPPGDDGEYCEHEKSFETPITPKKRSRSPMKKIFGENGWLGRSPSELEETKRRAQKAVPERKEKTSMLGKLKNKLEEFAEKADLSPNRGMRFTENLKNYPILSISVQGHQQATIYMEVEFMLVHTANYFLMEQFSQGRMVVDTIKRTVEMWKAKGRQTVREFMYDQSTQRDLVAANQTNFRFYGERSGDILRINSMLYNWKQVASLMAIRTFCNTDTVILKLLFDVPQILELLGARETALFRIQQIRASVKDMIRVAREHEENNSPIREKSS